MAHGARREVVRHVLHRLHLDGLVVALRAARGDDVSYLRARSRRDAFRRIYASGVWLERPDQVTRSGAGSEVGATAALRASLPQALQRLGVTSLLDVGCGDFTWMSAVDLDGVDYLGVDIVPEVVERNTAAYGGPGRAFRCLDAVTEPLPTADAVLCREVLFHLSFGDARAVLDAIRRSGATYLLATSDRGNRFNADVRSGDFRPLDLRRRPFRFPEPLAWLPDDGVRPGRALGVWRVADLRR